MSPLFPDGYIDTFKPINKLVWLRLKLISDRHTYMSVVAGTSIESAGKLHSDPRLHDHDNPYGLLFATLMKHKQCLFIRYEKHQPSFNKDLLEHSFEDTSDVSLDSFRLMNEVSLVLDLIVGEMFPYD